jgi:hypothetical protein
VILSEFPVSEKCRVHEWRVVVGQNEVSILSSSLFLPLPPQRRCFKSTASYTRPAHSLATHGFDCPPSSSRRTLSPKLIKFTPSCLNLPH